jgi:hypothetical protein
MAISVQMINTGGVERRCSANETVHFIALFQEKFGKIGAILASDARDQGSLRLTRLVSSSSFDK